MKILLCSEAGAAGRARGITRSLRRELSCLRTGSKLKPHKHPEQSPGKLLPPPRRGPELGRRCSPAGAGDARERQCGARTASPAPGTRCPTARELSPHLHPAGPPNSPQGQIQSPSRQATGKVPAARPRLWVLAQDRLFPSRMSCREHFVPTSRPRSQGTDSAPAGLLLWH